MATIYVTTWAMLRFLLFVLLSPSLGDARSDLEVDTSVLQEPNANHIFNAIHSSMRQWGSSLQHNGMSAFVATVPGGTEFYHGREDAEPVKGMEWLAFEPEHALQFAIGRRFRPPPERGDDGLNNDPNLNLHAQSHELGSEQQEPLVDVAVEEDSGEETGWLHAYRAKHELRLLYLDGQSAAKADLGTLDLQDVVLLHNNPIPWSILEADDGLVDDDENWSRKPPGGGMMIRDRWRATVLCDLAKTEWNNHIDGILRMEMGFEIILCDFERDLIIERVTAAKNWADRTASDNERENFNYYHVVASRYDGIGGDRVNVGNTDFVSLFAIPGALEWTRTGLPRVINESRPVEAALKQIKEMILNSANFARPSKGVDWQAVADNLVARYADRIRYIAESSTNSLEDLRAELDRAMRPFVDYRHRNKTNEIDKCASYGMPVAVDAHSLSARVLHDVGRVICVSLMKSAEQNSLADAVEVMAHLMQWLSWTTWRRCPACGYDGVCFLPIWPWGGVDDMRNIRCRNEMWNISSNYWR